MRILISPGLPRSGTTYVYEQLARANAKRFNLPAEKETNFFDRSSHNQDFLRMYRDFREDRYCIDYSPSYLVVCGRSIKNILRIEAEEIKIILHLRNPVDQIYSHYLHDLKSHIAKRQFGDNLHRCLFDPNVLAKYLTRRSEAVGYLCSELGRENILVVNFHQDLRSPGRLRRKISSFLDMELTEFSDQVVSPGGWLPYFVYGGQSGCKIAVGKHSYTIAPGGVLLVNGHESEFWTGLTPDTVSNLLLSASTWTGAVSPEQYDLIYAACREDWLSVLSTLGQREADYVTGKSLSASRPTLPPESADLFFEQDDLARVLQTAIEMAGQARFAL